MKKRRLSILDRCIDIAPVFFLVGISLCAAFLFWGELIYPDERDELDSYYQELNSDWYQELEDGSRVEVDVPGKVAVQRGEKVTFVTTLPETVENGSYVCFRPIWQDMNIYVGGKLREVHNTKNSRPFGENSAFRYVFVRLTKEDAGKELRYESVSDSKYSGSIRSAYYGEKSSIWMNLVANTGAKAVAALTLGVMGFFSILVCFVLRFINNWSCYGMNNTNNNKEGLEDEEYIYIENCISYNCFSYNPCRMHGGKRGKQCCS